MIKFLFIDSVQMHTNYSENFGFILCCKTEESLQCNSRYLGPLSSEQSISPQLIALGQLEFRKAFLILSYLGRQVIRYFCVNYSIFLVPHVSNVDC